MAGVRRSVSLCSWACNEEAIIDEFVRKTIEDLKRVADDYELIIVDDGSTDGTLARLRALQATTPALRVTSHGRNLGYGKCFSTTLQMATKEVVLWNTVDMFFDTSELPTFLQYLGDYDLIQGVRTDLRANHLRGKLTTIGNYWLIRMLFGIRMSEFQNVKVLTRELMDRIHLQARSGFVNAEIGLKAHFLGARIKEVPMQFHSRKGGEPKGAPVPLLWATIFDILVLWFQWVVLRRVPRAAVRHPVAILPEQAWREFGFRKGRSYERV